MITEFEQIRSLFAEISQFIEENAKSEYIQRHNPGVSGFSSQNLGRMRQFYETYKDDVIRSTLSSELSWSVNTKINFYTDPACPNGRGRRVLK